MTAQLEREGIFMARPLSWEVREAKSGAVGVNMKFLILAQLDEREGEDGEKTYTWLSWEKAEEHEVWGTIYVIKKDGTPSDTGVEQLVQSLGWTGSLAYVKNSPVPSSNVQVTVKSRDYNGKTYYDVNWMNPADYEPSASGGASKDDVDRLDARFGSLLRAAASVSKPAAQPDTKSDTQPEPQPAAAGPTSNPDEWTPLDD